jgi:hypothetical protein
MKIKKIRMQDPTQKWYKSMSVDIDHGIDKEWRYDIQENIFEYNKLLLPIIQSINNTVGKQLFPPRN